MLNAVQGRDTSVRDTISKGRFVQGAQHPRIFGRGHIGWGHINPASIEQFRRDNGHLNFTYLEKFPFVHCLNMVIYVQELLFIK
jgi:hypothetical protein